MIKGAGFSLEFNNFVYFLYDILKLIIARCWNNIMFIFTFCVFQ